MSVWNCSRIALLGLHIWHFSRWTLWRVFCNPNCTLVVGHWKYT